MDILFDRHLEYLSDVPTEFTRGLMNVIDWDSRLVMIRGPKGVGKSTLMQQYVLKNYLPTDRHILYCSADTAYFSNHTLLDTASEFVKMGGKVLLIDEIHKYENWSREIKEIYDLYKGLKVILSGSSLIQLNDGQADLSRRADVYDMPGLSFREYLWFRTKREKSKTYKNLVEHVVNYIIDSELTRYRGISVSNTRKISALLQVISGMLPYLVDVSKLSRSLSIDRVTLLKYFRYLDEAKVIRCLYTEMDKISDLQKPDKLLMDNTNLLYTFSDGEPETGTARETFFCNQLASAGHKIEYGGLKTGDFRIDHKNVIEVGGAGKDYSQINDADINNAALAVDNIEMANGRKIPLWAFGCLY